MFYTVYRFPKSGYSIINQRFAVALSKIDYLPLWNHEMQCIFSMKV